MAEAFRSRRLTWRIIFVLLATVIAFLQLLPLNPGPGQLPGPELFVLFTFAWVLRRPEHVPTLLVAIVILLADFLFLRPPGLWAAIVVVGLEFLRSRESSLRDVSFFAEWGVVAVLLTGMWVSATLILLIFGVDQPPFGLTLIQLIFSVLAYPPVVFVTAGLFGLKKVSPGEFNQLGRRA